MKHSKTVKIAVDAAMSGGLLAQMSYQVSGQEAHEWIGAGLLVLFLLHNLLNRNWYKNLTKGRYTPIRTIQTAVNILTLAAMLCLMVSGIIMSRYAFGFLNIEAGMSLARLMHLAAAYWGFVFMGIHLGLHWGMIFGMFHSKRKGRDTRQAEVVLLRCIAAVIAACGLYVFIQNGIPGYLFLQSQFAFFDFDKNATLVFAENIAVMWLWVWIGHYAARLARRHVRK